MANYNLFPNKPVVVSQDEVIEAINEVSTPQQIVSFILKLCKESQYSSYYDFEIIQPLFLKLCDILSTFHKENYEQDMAKKLKDFKAEYYNFIS